MKNIEFYRLVGSLQNENIILVDENSLDADCINHHVEVLIFLFVIWKVGASGEYM